MLLLHLQHADLALHVGEDPLQPRRRRRRSPAAPASRGSSGCRWPATVSASLAGSSIWLIETSTSGAIFLLSLMYCSNCSTTVRASASVSGGSVAVLVERRRPRPRSSDSVSLKPAMRGAPPALDQHLHGAVRQLQQLQHGGDGADVDRWSSAAGSSCAAFFWATSRICLSSRITASSARTDLLAADEERHDHVREHDDVPQRQHRQQFARGAVRWVLSAMVDLACRTVDARAARITGRLTARPAASRVLERWVAGIAQYKRLQTPCQAAGVAPDESDAGAPPRGAARRQAELCSAGRSP